MVKVVALFVALDKTKISMPHNEKSPSDEEVVIFSTILITKI